ncbi:DNA-binding response regulator [Aliidongia dinghuensis]|uniref:DNA-binding response regulator n=1 Tax=Aliidongia dinghuensis TaxID=1867774 RepID=A0A8J3E3Z8_9PROT|nr:response regulator FixJ [Aliidongia dinghuensis]GGF19955.1 DNA-binding response regulator [Aliidongia dinghuensis]
MIDGVVHVIDDDEAVRDSLRFMLEAARFDVHTYESATAFLELLPMPATGCIVTDVRMADTNGLELIRHLKRRGAGRPVIVITGHADVPLAVEAMKAGVVDFIEKPFDEERLIGSIRSALNGEGRLVETDSPEAIRARLVALSARERDVLDGVVSGRSNKVIAFQLGISPRTVEVYRANLMSKMQAGSLSELVRMALLAERH